LLLPLNSGKLHAENLDLIDIFQLAEANDPRFLQQKSKRNSSLELKSQAIAVLLPTISATGRSNWNYLRNKKFNFQSVGIQRFWSHTGQIDVSQPIFNLDSWFLLSQSEYQITKAEALLAKSYQDLIIRTVNAYLNVLLAQETVDLTRAELKARQQLLEQAKLRFEVGLAPVTQSLEAEARHAATSASLAAAKAALIDAQSALQEITGHPSSDQLLPLAPELILESPEPGNVNQWKLYAINRNRELMAAVSDVKVAEKQVDREKARHYPTITGTASYSFNDNNSTFGLRGETGLIGVQVNVPIFSGGRIMSRVRQAHYNLQASKQVFEQTKRSVDRSVTKTFFDVKSNIDQVEAIRKSVRSFERVLETIQVGMEVGSNTLVDVLDAQTDFYKAKRDLSSQQFAYLMSWLKLRLAAGLLEQSDVVRLNGYLQNVSEEPSS